MNIKHTKARTGDNYLTFVSWYDEIGRPIENVEDVRFTLFAYDGINKVTIQDNVLMNVSDLNHRYLASIAIPQGYEGGILYIDFKCTYQADDSVLRAEEIILIEKPLNEQILKVSF